MYIYMYIHTYIYIYIYIQNTYTNIQILEIPEDPAPAVDKRNAVRVVQVAKVA